MGWADGRGGFVFHCNWNSTLQSIYFGGLIATRLLYIKQQTNAQKIGKGKRSVLDINMWLIMLVLILVGVVLEGFGYG